MQVCTAFLALSLREAGYTVFANAEASGTVNKRVADDANERMRSAGVHVCSMFAIAADLMKDWRNGPGALELLPFFDKSASGYNDDLKKLSNGFYPQVLPHIWFRLPWSPCGCRFWGSATRASRVGGPRVEVNPT